MARAPLLPHADRARRTRRRLRGSRARRSTSSATPSRSGTSCRALTPASRGTCRSRWRDGARPRWRSPAGTPRCGCCCTTRRASSGRRWASGATPARSASASSPRSPSRTAPAARATGATLLLLLLDAFRRQRLRFAEAAAHGRTVGGGAAVRVRRDDAARARPSAGRRCSVSELERLAARAREEGRLGIDTEFMPEGRYRPLLCLVQVCVGDEIVVLDPLEDELGDPAPLAAVLADPGGRGRAARRAARTSRSCAAPGARRSRTCSTRRSRPASPGFSAQAGYTGLLHDVLKIRLAKSASFTRWDARPLTPEQLRYAREDVEHLLPLADELQRRLSRARAAGVGARGVPRDRGGDRRARARGRLAAAAADLRARPARARAGARARRLARAHRGRRGPPGRLRRARPDAGRARQARAVEREGAGPDPRRGAGRRPPPRARHPRRRRARPRRARRSGSTRATGSRPTPSTGRRSRSPRRWCGRAPQEAGLAYELIAARADLAPIVVAARRSQPEPDVRTLRGWRRELVGDELLELLAGNRSLGVVNGRVDVG